MNAKDPQKTRRTIVFTASTIAFVIFVGLIYLISNLPSLSSWFGSLGRVFAPVLGGLILAYLCNPILRFFERYPLRRISSVRFKRMLSIFLTYLFFILIIALLGMLIFPHLIRSVQELFAKFDNYIANAVTYINQLLTSIMGSLPPTEDGLPQEFISLDKINALLSTLGDSLSDIANIAIQNIAAYGSKLVSVITDGILALFISFYLLASKEKRGAQIKKLTAAVFNEKQNKFIYDTTALINSAFGNFISGKILDSLFVTIVETILFSIFGIPYAPMLACILGMTNLVPFFGPIIGTIPSGFIVLISAPAKFVPFLIIMLLVQQVDANIIEPRILGDRTGVSPLCVLIAISIMGNLWGVIGMILGVPLFAVILALVQQFMDARLSAKGMSTNVDDYYNEEPAHDAALSQRKAHLSWRYYLDKVRYVVLVNKRSSMVPPNKQDYIIYPTESTANAATSAEQPASAEMPADAPETAPEEMKESEQSESVKPNDEGSV